MHGEEEGKVGFKPQHMTAAGADRGVASRGKVAAGGRTEVCGRGAHEENEEEGCATNELCGRRFEAHATELGRTTRKAGHPPLPPLPSACHTLHC